MFDIDKLSIYFPVMKPGRMKVDQTDNYTKLLELEKEILLHPDNAHHLFMPVVDDIFAQDAYSEIYQQLENSPMEEEKSIFSSLTPQTNVNKSIIFVKGKLGVGIVARDITGQSVGQADGLSINQRYITIEDGQPKTNPTMLFFEGLEDNYFLSNYTSSSNRIIAEVLSQLMTTQVDNVKNPVGVKLGINMQTLSIVGYLVRRNVDAKAIIKLIKQPLVLEYLKAQKVNESLINKNNGDELMKAKLIEKVLRSKGYREKGPYTIAALGNWRINNTELNRGLTERKFDQEQLRMFSYFLELVNQTRALSKWTNDQTADTTGLKDRASVEAMMQNREESRANEFIDPVLQTQISATGVISPFTKARDNYDSMWSEFYFTVNSLYKDKILAFKQQLTGLQRTKAKKEKALSTIDNDFILFFVHNFSLKNQSSFEQLTGKTEAPSLAQRIKDVKKSYPDNLVLKAFFPIVKSKLDETDNQYIDSLRLFERQLTTIDINDFVDSMRDIADVDLQLYNDLITFVFYQSGLNNSPFNYSNIIPIANNKSNSPEYEKLFSSILQEAIANAKQVVTNDAQAQVIFDQFVNAFLHNNKQFLRSKSFKSYPYNLLNRFDKSSKKFKLFDTTIGEFVPELGNTFMKRYNTNLLSGEIKTQTDESILNDESIESANMFFGPNVPTDIIEDSKKGLQLRGRKLGFTKLSDISDPVNKTLYDKLLSIENTKMIVVEGLNYKLPNGRIATPLGTTTVDSKGNRIVYVDSKSTGTIALHEMVHYHTSRMIDEKPNDPDVLVLKYLFNHVKNSTTNQKVYGLINVHEFIAEAFTSHEFAKYLQTVPYKATNVLDWLLNAIANLLGVQRNILQQVYDAANAIIDKQQSLQTGIGKQANLNYESINKEEVSKNNPEVVDNTLYNEVMTNFLSYFPQYDYMNEEQQSEVAKLVANGTIQITCKFG